MRRFLYMVLVMACGSLGAFLPAAADDDGTAAKEYAVKAAFLYNFVKFVEWPAGQSLAQTHAANICIIGDDPFGSALDIFQRASSPQLALNVRRNVPIAEASGCHLLFISQSEEEHVTSILAHVRAYPVLTVSDIPGFVEKGGIIEMSKNEKNIGLFSKDKINLRINERAAQAENLRVDAQLLEIAGEVIK